MENLRDVRVLVTGGTGFIGSHLVRRLINEGAKVTVISKESHSKAYNISDVIKDITLIKADITDLIGLKKIVSKVKPSKVFHLAAYVNPERYLNKIGLCYQNNVLGTLNLIHALKNTNYDCFINTGTCEEYGTAKAPFREDTQVKPVSPYSASKASATLLCSMLYTSFGLPIVTVRPFLTYGPYQRAHLFIPTLIMHALTGKDFRMTKGEQTREFNYVTDIVDAFILASLTKKAIGELINIGNSKEYKIKEVAQMICKLTNKEINLDFSLPYRKGEVMHFYSDSSKAKKLLGWKPKVSLQEGLKITIDWYAKKYKDGSYTKWMN